MKAMLKISLALVVVLSFGPAGFQGTAAMAGPAGGGGDSWSGSGGYPDTAGGFHYEGDGGGYFSSPGGWHHAFHRYSGGGYAGQYFGGSYAAGRYPGGVYASQSVRWVQPGQTYSYASARSLKTGDRATVAAPTADMKVGDRVVESVPAGTPVTVLAVQGPWIGVNVERNGQQASGWILMSDLSSNTNTSSASTATCAVNRIDGLPWGPSPVWSTVVSAEQRKRNFGADWSPVRRGGVPRRSCKSSCGTSAFRPRWATTLTWMLTRWPTSFGRTTVRQTGKLRPPATLPVTFAQNRPKTKKAPQS